MKNQRPNNHMLRAQIRRLKRENEELQRRVDVLEQRLDATSPRDVNEQFIGRRMRVVSEGPLKNLVGEVESIIDDQYRLGAEVDGVRQSLWFDASHVVFLPEEA